MEVRGRRKLLCSGSLLANKLRLHNCMLSGFICYFFEAESHSPVAIVFVRHATRKHSQEKYNLPISEGEGKFRDVAWIACKVWRNAESIQSSHDGD